MALDAVSGVVVAAFVDVIGGDVAVMLGVLRGMGNGGTCWGVLRGDNCLSGRC